MKKIILLALTAFHLHAGQGDIKTKALVKIQEISQQHTYLCEGSALYTQKSIVKSINGLESIVKEIVEKQKEDHPERTKNITFFYNFTKNDMESLREFIKETPCVEGGRQLTQDTLIILQAEIIGIMP